MTDEAPSPNGFGCPEPGSSRCGDASLGVLSPLSGVGSVPDLGISIRMTGKGEIIVTALQLISDVHVLRSGAFAQVSFKP